MMRIPVQKHLAAAALALGTCGSLAIGLTAPAAPASAQITVFDPSNYAQSVLTAARTLQQVDQQIQIGRHTSELQSLMRISYAVFCLKKKKHHTNKQIHHES